MAWQAPRTWTADQLVKASELNQDVRDNELILKTPLDDTGKIIAIDSTRFVDLSGVNITGVAKLASANTYTAKNDFTGASGKLIVPIGADKWAT